MTVLTPTFVSVADSVITGTSSSDPRWTSLTFADGTMQGVARTASRVIAMPAPGYAICWGTGAGGRAGFMEVAFTAAHFWDAEITELRWTDALDDSDYASGDSSGAGPMFTVFPDDGAIVVTSVPGGGASSESLYHRRFTYGPTFGSVAADTGVGRLTWASGPADQRFQHDLIDPTTIVWLSHEFVGAGGGYQDRYRLWYGTATVGTDSTTSSGTLVEPQDEFPALSGDNDGLGAASVHFIDDTSVLLVAAYVETDVTTDYATAVWSSGVGGWTAQGVGASLDNMPGWETLGRTVAGRRYRTDQDTNGSQNISGDWITPGVDFEADTGEVLLGISGYAPLTFRDGTSFQTFGAGLVEAEFPTPPRYHRVWDTATGENVEAWDFSVNNTRRAQIDDKPAWLGATTGSIGGIHLLMVFEEEPTGHRYVGKVGRGGPRA